MTDDSDNLDGSRDVTLSAADAAAMDRILDHAASAAAPGLAVTDAATREARIGGWLKALGAAAAPSAPTDLADRTLALIERERMKLRPAAAAMTDQDIFKAPIRRRWSRRMAEIGAMAIAAMLLLAVVLMGVGQARQSKARIACDENLQKWSTAFASFAAANSNELPSLAMPADRNWLSSSDAAAAHSNSANLLPLVTGKYISQANLYCAGAVPATLTEVTANDAGKIGYSYAYQYGPVRPKWDGNPATIILADRNPMFVPGARVSAAEENSPNHGGHGNYVLRADGAVTWETSPNIGPHGDNIWTVNNGTQLVTTYTGTETPASPADAFVCP